MASGAGIYLNRSTGIILKRLRFQGTELTSDLNLFRHRVS